MSRWTRGGGTFVVAVVITAAVLVCFEITPVDLALQDVFFNFSTGEWWIDQHEPVGRALFYTGPKVVIILIFLGVIAVICAPSRWLNGHAMRRRDAIIAAVTLATIPVLAGNGKGWTNVFCPSQIRRYGGDVPYVRVFETYPANDRPARRGHCFPAGHCSGGFALIGLAWLRRSRRWQRNWFIATLVAGWTMGLYQMFKGAHFLSHTVATMLLAWIVVIAWRSLLRGSDGEAAAVGGVPAQSAGQ